MESGGKIRSGKFPLTVAGMLLGNHNQAPIHLKVQFALSTQKIHISPTGITLMLFIANLGFV